MLIEQLAGMTTHTHIIASFRHLSRIQYSKLSILSHPLLSHFRYCHIISIPGSPAPQKHNLEANVVTAMLQ